MAYLASTIAWSGTEDIFIKMIRNAFLNNKIFGFELEEENFTTRPYYFVVRKNSFAIKVSSKLSDETSTGCYLSLDFGIIGTGLEISKENINYVGAVELRYSKSKYKTVDQNVSRLIYLLIVQNENDIFVDFTSYDKEMGKIKYDGQTKRVTNLKTDNYEIISYRFGSDSTTSINYSGKIIVESNEGCTLKPIRDYSKSDSELFLHRELPIFKTDNSTYLTKSTGVITLGGAKAQSFYTMKNDDKYYCIEDNIAIKLGEEIEYDIFEGLRGDE